MGKPAPVFGQRNAAIAAGKLEEPSSAVSKYRNHPGRPGWLRAVAGRPVPAGGEDEHRLAAAYIMEWTGAVVRTRPKKSRGR